MRRAGKKKSPYDAEEQTRLGQRMIDVLAEELPGLLKDHNPFKEAPAIQLDGYRDDPLTLCEAWARIGKPHGSQFDKIAADVLKLLYARKRLNRPDARMILVFASEEASAAFQSESWMSKAITEFGVECRTVQLGRAEKESLKRAQASQAASFRSDSGRKRANGQKRMQD